MKSSAPPVPLAVLLVACGGPDPVPEAELDDVCGAPSPFRVLELAPDEVVRAGETVRVHDRIVYVVSRLDPLDADAEYSSTAESTVWSAGPCGESPVQLAGGIEDIFTVDIWPDLVLGCEKATGDVVVLDPTGAAAPHVAFPGVSQFPYPHGCGLAWTDEGLLSVQKHDDELGALLLHPFPDDPLTDTSTAEVLLDPIRLGPGGGLGIIPDVLYTFADHVLALTPDDTLVRIDLTDRAVSTLQTNVAAFAATLSYWAPEGSRYLIWQDTAVTKDHATAPEGKIFLRDQLENRDTLLGETALRFTGFRSLLHADQGVVQLAFGPLYPGNAPLRLFRLPQLDAVEFTSDLYLGTPLPDGRWLAQARTLVDQFVDVLDLSSGERTRLFPREAEVEHFDDDAVIVLEAPACCIDSDRRAEGPMWRVPFDGGSPVQLATRATRFMTRTDDGRLIGPVAAGNRWLADLVVIDTATRAESRIDDYVHLYSIDTSRLADEGIISYSVADGDRSGVYLARLPASARSRTSPRSTDRQLAHDQVRDRDGRIVVRPRLPGALP